MRLLLLFLLTFSNIFATSSYEKGKDLYIQKACYSCHGHKIEGISTFPALANRSKGYMTYKLKHFRERKADTQRQEMMIDFAVNLSDEDIDNLTTFFADYVDVEKQEKYDDSYDNYGDGGS
ncbi:c-type cytochrome [Sulfurimonas sp.]|uniref:c-type cytochrome n=1 Tax=Sulfurimonas sp. TaxID=2022749 RepID=UPI0025F430DA|nr:c-type cytochrome [Sulfurimonas sp.]MBT5935938.1 cytochrome c [Sulfurimonas sp.]